MTRTAVGKFGSVGRSPTKGKIYLYPTMTRPHDQVRTPPASPQTICTYWREFGAYAGLIEGVEFFCTGDGLVDVEFHGGREGRWIAPGLRCMAANNGELMGETRA